MVGRRRGDAPAPRTLALLGAVAVGLLAPVLLVSPGSAAEGDCRSARTFADLGRQSTAVALFDRAQQDGAPCGSAERAREARGRLDEARDLSDRGRAAEDRGRDAGARRLYGRAIRINAEDAGAISGLSRLTDAPADASSTAPESGDDPFAAARTLDGLGRHQDAEAAALAAVQAGDPPDSEAEELLHYSWPDRVRLWITRVLGSWWPFLALLLVGAALLLALLARRRRTRPPSDNKLLNRIAPLRLAVEVEQVSGTQPDLAAGFAVQVRTRVRELDARNAHDPRVVYGSDASVDVPLEAVPGQAKYLAGLWRWFRRSNTVTLRVTLLPASPEGVGCHVVLLERNGAATKDVVVPEQVLWHRPSPWAFDPSPTAAWSALQWMPLANLATAWALFAFRSLQVPAADLREEFGTSSGEAFGEMLAGLEHSYDPDAMRHYQKAVEIDPDFMEAQLNLATALGTFVGSGSDGKHLDEAETILTTEVLGPLDVSAGDPTDAPSTSRRVRERRLRLRAEYSRVIVRFNRMAGLLDDRPLEAPARDGIATLCSDIGRLDDRVRTNDQDAGGDADDLAALRRQMAPHVRVMRAGALDLAAKVALGHRQADAEGVGSPQGYAGLPTSLDPTQADHEDQATAVGIIREYRMTGTPTRLHYTLACIWARDHRMRTTGREEALARCVERLWAAREDPLYRERWPRDPDLKPIRDRLLVRLAEKDAELADEARLDAAGETPDDVDPRLARR